QERRALATSRRGIGRQPETDVLQRCFVPLVNVRVSRQRPRRSRFDSGFREPGVANSSQIRQCPFRESSPKLALQSVDFFDGPPLSRRKVSTAGHRRPTDVDFPDCRTRRRTLRTLHGTLHRALVRSHLHRCTRALQQTSQNLATTTVQLSERRGITPRLTRPYLLEHPFRIRQRAIEFHELSVQTGEAPVGRVPFRSKPDHGFQHLAQPFFERNLQPRQLQLLCQLVATAENIVRYRCFRRHLPRFRHSHKPTLSNGAASTAEFEHATRSATRAFLGPATGGSRRGRPPSLLHPRYACRRESPRGPQSQTACPLVVLGSRRRAGHNITQWRVPSGTGCIACLAFLVSRPLFPADPERNSDSQPHLSLQLNTPALVTPTPERARRGTGLRYALHFQLSSTAQILEQDFFGGHEHAAAPLAVPSRAQHGIVMSPPLDHHFPFAG